MILHAAIGRDSALEKSVPQHGEQHDVLDESLSDGDVPLLP
jgi:hypothetical protein